MANKFGKFLLFTAAVGTAAAAAYYYVHKKDADSSYPMDDDYDDFSDECDDPVSTSRNYVALNIDGKDTSAPEDDADFTPLSEQLAVQEEAPLEETVEDVEEFFDEEDSSEEEPPIEDN